MVCNTARGQEMEEVRAMIEPALRMLLQEHVVSAHTSSAFAPVCWAAAMCVAMALTHVCLFCAVQPSLLEVSSQSQVQYKGLVDALVTPIISGVTSVFPLLRAVLHAPLASQSMAVCGVMWCLIELNCAGVFNDRVFVCV